MHSLAPEKRGDLPALERKKLIPKKKTPGFFLDQKSRGAGGRSSKRAGEPARFQAGGRVGKGAYLLKKKPPSTKGAPEKRNNKKTSENGSSGGEKKKKFRSQEITSSGMNEKGKKSFGAAIVGTATATPSGKEWYRLTTT